VLLIPCPYCGPRDEAEFRCGGEADLVRPGPAASDAQWTDYLFMRDNRKGVQRERWCHVHGCRQWFQLVRNTATHEMVEAFPMGAPSPGPGE